MKKRGIRPSLCLGLAVLGGCVLPAAGVLVQTSFSNNTSQIYYPASGSDLLNWGQASMSSNVCVPASLTWGNASNLNDGALGTANSTTLAAGHGTVWTNTFYLNTSVNTNGYSITNIATVAGWSASRTSQKYGLLFAFKDAPQTFYSYGTAQLNYVPSADGSSKIQLTDTSGIIAANVCAIRFVFDANTIYREVDVFGYATPSVVIEPIITGGTGPGGIGTTNGASTLSLWVKADSLALTNGAQVASWPDSSGGGTTLPGAGTTAGYPAFTNNLLNGHPGILFSGISYFLRSNVTVAVHEAYVVARFNGATFGNYNGLLMGDPWQNTNYMINAKANTNMLAQNAGGSLAAARRNGLTLTNADFNPVNQTWIGSLVLGADQTSPHISVGAMFQPNTGGGRCWQGEIAEVATFGNPFGSGLNTLQRSIIENYLSAK